MYKYVIDSGLGKILLSGLLCVCIWTGQWWRFWGLLWGLFPWLLPIPASQSIEDVCQSKQVTAVWKS